MGTENEPGMRQVIESEMVLRPRKVLMLLTWCERGADKCSKQSRGFRKTTNPGTTRDQNATSIGPPLYLAAAFIQPAGFTHQTYHFTNTDIALIAASTQLKGRLDRVSGITSCAHT